MHLNPGANSCYVVECWNLSISCSLFFSYFVLALPLMFFLYSRNLQTSSCQQPTRTGLGGRYWRHFQAWWSMESIRQVSNYLHFPVLVAENFTASEEQHKEVAIFSPKQKSGDSSILRGHWGDRIQSPSVVGKRHQTTMISHNMALGLQGMVSGWWFLNKI